MNSHKKEVFKVNFSPDNKLVISASADKSAIIWNAKDGSFIRKLIHYQDVYSVAFSADGQKIVTGSADKSVRIWNAENGKEILKI